MMCTKLRDLTAVATPLSLSAYAAIGHPCCMKTLDSLECDGMTSGGICLSDGSVHHVTMCGHAEESGAGLEELGVAVIS